MLEIIETTVKIISLNLPQRNKLNEFSRECLCKPSVLRFSAVIFLKMKSIYQMNNLQII